MGCVAAWPWQQAEWVLELAVCALEVGARTAKSGLGLAEGVQVAGGGL